MNKPAQHSSTPYFSIIIPTYNRANLIGTTIESVLHQSFKNWELLIVDDGSTDDTKSRVEAYQDARINYFYQENQERCIARNNGINQANGKYICFLDSDDYFLEHHLQTFFQAVKKENEAVAIFRTGFYLNREEEQEPSPFYNQKKHGHPITFFLENMVGIHTLCIHRDILQQHQFSPTLHHWQDTHLLLRILVDYSFFQISKHTCVYVFHEDMGTQNIYHRPNSIERIELNVYAIHHLFDNYGEKLAPFTSKDARNYLIGMKYIHHANGALMHQKNKLSLFLIKKAWKEDRKGWFWWWYIKFFIKFPFYFLTQKFKTCPKPSP